MQNQNAHDNAAAAAEAVGAAHYYNLSKDGLTNVAARYGVYQCSPDVAPAVDNILKNLDERAMAIAYARARENGRVTVNADDIDFAAGMILSIPKVITGN